jgi:hypothetical protein
MLQNYQILKQVDSCISLFLLKYFILEICAINKKSL